MPFLNVFVIFCVCIHTLSIQIVTFTQFEIRTSKNDIFFLRKIGWNIALLETQFSRRVWRGTAGHLSLVVFAWIKSLAPERMDTKCPEGPGLCPKVLQTKLGHFCKVSHGPECQKLFSKHVVTHKDRLPKKNQWGVAMFANVQGSRSCVAQPREVVIVVYSA